MDSSWAAEHLQTIRTLMERAAMYRRALAPIMLVVGFFGTTAAAVGIFTRRFESNQSFAVLWLATAAVSVVASYLLVRRQAFKEQEDFWSPPTRRVTQALVPGFLAGGMAGALLAIGGDQFARATWLLAVAWVMAYGCALHAAGFFMHRGIKLFGISLVSVACVWLVVAAFVPYCQVPRVAHGIMGVCFGVAHLLYGAYLHFTEKRAQS
jgi:drug/metabolite transporter (DMT)-like permease